MQNISRILVVWFKRYHPSFNHQFSKKYVSLQRGTYTNHFLQNGKIFLHENGSLRLHAPTETLHHFSFGNEKTRVPIFRKNADLKTFPWYSNHPSFWGRSPKDLKFWGRSWKTPKVQFQVFQKKHGILAMSWKLVDLSYKNVDFLVMVHDLICSLGQKKRPIYRKKCKILPDPAIPLTCSIFSICPQVHAYIHVMHMPWCQLLFEPDFSAF